MWYEGLGLILCYVVYIITMVYNHKLMGLCPTAKTAKYVVTPVEESQELEEPEGKTDEGDDKKKCIGGDDADVFINDAANYDDDGDEADVLIKHASDDDDADVSINKRNDASDDDGDDADDADVLIKHATDDDDADVSIDHARPCCKDGKAKCCVGWFWSILKAPWVGIFTITIPHPEKCPKLYVLTFIMCIMWMGGLCFIEVILVSFLGCTWNMDATVLGISFLAVGTSVPDAVASIIVARNGLGDMAIANALGSNVFDMLLGLGLPWFLGDVIFRATGDAIGSCGLPVGIFVNRDGIIVNTLILLATVAVYGILLAACKCHLNCGVALGLFIWYVLYLAITISSELCMGGFTWKMNNHNCDAYGGSIFAS